MNLWVSAHANGLFRSLAVNAGRKLSLARQMAHREWPQTKADSERDPPRLNLFVQIYDARYAL